MLAKYANQNIFQINRDMPAKGTQKKYLAIYQDNIFDAMQDLCGEAAIKVYIYLCSNQNSFNLDFSPKHCAMACGISENSARNATKQLIEKGYLVQDSKNHYQFSESPQKKPVIQIGKEERRYVPTDEGKKLLTYAEVYRLLKEDGKPDEQISQLWHSWPIAEEE